MKKGALEIHYLITGIIAVVVLISVFVFLFFYSGNGLKFFKWIPFFGNNKTIDKQIILRYDIVEDKVEYYDLTEWNLIEDDGIIDYGDKGEVLRGKSLKDNFRNFYFKSKRGKTKMPVIIPDSEVSLIGFLAGLRRYSGTNRDYSAFENLIDHLLDKYSSYKSKLKSELRHLKINASILDFYSSFSSSIYSHFLENDFRKNGNLLIDFFDKIGFLTTMKIEEGVDFYFVLTYDDKLYFVYKYIKGRLNYFELDKKKLDEAFDKKFKEGIIYKYAKKWRDSVFNKTMYVEVFPGTNTPGPPRPIYICTYLKDKRYIIADFSKNLKKEKGDCK